MMPGMMPGTMPGTMRRLPDWQVRLVRHLCGAASAPFVPGRNDCALFAAAGVQAMTGCDLAAGWRGRYRTIRGGLRMLRRAGYADHLALVAAHFAQVAPAYAAPGDLAAVPGPDGMSLGIVQGAGIYVLTPGGLATVSRLTAIAAWQVPA